MKNYKFLLVPTIVFAILEVLHFRYGGSRGLVSWAQSVLPANAIGDLLMLIIWIGALPLALAFPLLNLVPHFRQALVGGAVLTLLAAILEPLRNNILATEVGRPMAAMTWVMNSLSILLAGLVIFFVSVVLPAAVRQFFRRKF